MIKLSQKWFNVFCIFILFGYVNSLYAQNIDQVIRFGDTLFQKKSFFSALNEYQRAFFFCETDTKSELCLKIADCYLSMNEIKKAQTFCDTAFYYAQNDSIKTECILQRTFCNILERNYGNAILQLNMLNTSANVNLNLKKELYLGISLVGLERFDEADKIFYELFSSTDSIKMSKFIKLNEGNSNLSCPNHGIASLMSILIPGTGQIYAGNIHDGINSIILLSGLILIGIDTPVSFLIIGPFFYRYYLGGILNANNHSKTKKREKKNQYYGDLLRIIENDNNISTLVYPGIKEKNNPNHNRYVLEEQMLLSSIFSFYKAHISSQDIDACIFYPSCSVYTLEAIEKKGALKGFLEGFDRILRCHSLATKNDYQYDKTMKKYYDPLQ